MVSSPSTKARGRPREFDEEFAIDRAMNAFWSGGYHATALPDLLAATKLSRGSLYAAFGGKRGLFLRALDLYIDRALARLDRELDPGRKALAGVRACVDGYDERTMGAAGRRGCLVVATAMELAGGDEEVSARIARFFAAMESRLAVALGRARDERDLAEDVDPAAVAHALMCLFEGLRVVRKVVPDQSGSLAAVHLVLDRCAR